MPTCEQAGRQLMRPISAPDGVRLRGDVVSPDLGSTTDAPLNRLLDRRDGGVIRGWSRPRARSLRPPRPRAAQTCLIIFLSVSGGGGFYVHPTSFSSFS